MSALPMPERVPEPGFYHHHRHNPNGTMNAYAYAYEVIGVGFHTENDTRPGEAHFVVYRPLYEGPIYEASKRLGIPCFYNRPLGMWMEDVEKDGKRFPRFQKITDLGVIGYLKKIRDQMYPKL